MQIYEFCTEKREKVVFLYEIPSFQVRQEATAAGGEDKHADWQLEHDHLQEADKDMPRVPCCLCDAESGGVEEWEGIRDDR